MIKDRVTQIKGLIFDKDGTLFDFNATWGGWAARIMRHEVGADTARLRQLAECLGFDLTAERFLPDSLAIAGTMDEIADTMLPHLPDADRSDLIARLAASAADNQMVEATPLKPFFAGLSAQGYRLGIATNDAEHPAEAHLDRAGIRAHFDFVAGYDSGFGAKPAPGQLVAFCDQLQLDPAACAMIGDSLHDLRAGRAAGMTTIGVLTGPADNEELSPMADVVLPSIADIPQWLAQ